MSTKSHTLNSKKRGWRKILFFSHWPLFCQILLLVNCLTSTGVFIYQMITLKYVTNTPFGALTLNETRYMIICFSYAANMINAVCLIMSSIRKISNYYWGILACIFLGIIAFFGTNTGSIITYWAIQIPMQIVGIVLWKRNSTDKKHVEPVALKWYWYIIGALILAVAIGLFAWLESWEKFSKNIWYPDGAWKPNQWRKYILDSSVLMLDIGAAILMVKRYKEQWILWVLLDVVNIALWYDHPTLVIMFAIALVSCGYGIWEWWIKPARHAKNP